MLNDCPCHPTSSYSGMDTSGKTVVHINKALDTVNHSTVHTASRLWDLLKCEKSV